MAKEERVTNRFHTAISMSNLTSKQMLVPRRHIQLQVRFAKSDFVGRCLEHVQLLHICTVKSRSS